MVTCQSANQLKTKVSWFFKMVSVWFTRRHNHGEDADLTVVQKTIIDTLHKEGKTQTFITKEAVHRVLYPSMLTESWVEGKSVEEKDAQPTERTAALRIVKKNRFKSFGELHKEWTEAGVKPSRAPHTDVSRNLATVIVRGVLPGLRRRTGLLPSGPKSFSDETKFCISFVNQGPRVWRKGGEAQSPSYLKSSVKFPQSVMIGGTMSSAGVGPLCFLKTNVTAPVYQDILEHFMLLLLLKMQISFSSRIWLLSTLPKAPKAG